MEPAPSRPAVVAIAGAAGEIGGRVARGLAGAVPLRVFSRDTARAESAAQALRAAAGGAAVEAGAVDYTDPNAELAMRGVDVLLMVSAAEAADRLDSHRTFIDSARRAGVRHVVYTSFVGAAPDSVFTLGRDHFHTEEHLRSSGMAWTILRDNFYQDIFPLFVGKDGILRGPSGDGRVAAVARDDVADCAAVVLREAANALGAGQSSAHAGRTYNLTGPEAFTLSEACAAITTLTGTAAAFHHESLEEAYASRAGYRADPWQVDAWVSTYTAIAAGDLGATTDDVESLLGRPARSLAQTLERPSAAGA
ncbi:NAD(P)H-binding protein [Arthrobacter sp. KK5.5]|uniref:NAD(P)H-binding protein n=1 Tax=Arthrobacter sp. KK5.5 TaxID=3373084 RepID=UPI003EE523C9